MWTAEIILLLAVGGIAVFAARAHSRANSLTTKVDMLERHLVALRGQVEALQGAFAGPLAKQEVPLASDELHGATTTTAVADAEIPRAVEPVDEPETESARVAPKADGEPDGTELDGVELQPETPAAGEEATPVADQETPEPAASTPSEPIAARAGAFEERLTSRWLVWLGGAVLAAGGIFLVKYSIDRGWLGPLPRVVLGVLFGLALVGGGEWLRRRPLQRAIAAVRPDYVPQALAAAGVLVLFASLYVAYVLYGFLPPLVAFVALALIAMAALALALVQGPVIAVLGVLGANSVPLLVSSEAPSALALFPYLLLVAFSALAVRRYRPWVWLGWCAWFGPLLLSLMWVHGLYSRNDLVVIAMFVLAMVGLFTYLRPLPELDGADRPLRVPLEGWVGNVNVTILFGRPLATAAIVGGALAAWLMLEKDGFGLEARIAAGLVCLLVFVIAWREEMFALALALVAGIALLVMLDWVIRLQALTPAWLDQQRTLTGDPGALSPFNARWQALAPFSLSLLALAGLFGGGGFLAQLGRRLPGYWATLSSGFVLLALILAYGGIRELLPDMAWGGLALALALASLGAAVTADRRVDRPGGEAALAAYAAATVALVSLAATMILEDAWLTVAIALELPALAWIHMRLRLRSLRYLAYVLAAVVLVRLTLNFKIVGYPLGGVAGFSWILYGYGLPALCFFAAARWFRRVADDRLVVLLESGALVFGVSLLSLEIRELVNPGRVWSSGYSLLEQSLHNLSWTATALGLMRLNLRTGRVVSAYGWRILLGLAALQLSIFQLTTSNPLLTDSAVWSMPVFNHLFLAYAVPAGMAVLVSRQAGVQGFGRLADAAMLVALGLAVVYVSLEIRGLVAPGIGLQHGYSLLEQALHNLAWVGLAVAFLHFLPRPEKWPTSGGWKVLLGLAAVQMVVFQLTFDNPLVTGKPVWGIAVFNLLLLAYAVPAGMALLVRREAQARGLNRLADGAGAAALVLVFVYLSLQVRYLFQGPVIGFGPTSDAEWYSYSLTWLLYAGGLLALGMVLGSRALRWASLGLVLLTLAKLVLFDASALTGLWRVASFLGLGLALVGIGYLYQRFVFPPGPGDVGDTEVGETQGNPDAR